MVSPFTRKKCFRRRIRCDGAVRGGPVVRTHIRCTTGSSPSATYIRTNLLRGSKEIGKETRIAVLLMQTSLLKQRLFLMSEIYMYLPLIS
ncbi:unnamed protein product [Spodoptera exigua]|nr:unnamed protein product [Spodoptera exigua]